MAENKKWSQVGEISTPSGQTMLCTIHTPVGSGDKSNKLINANALDYTKLSGTYYVFTQGKGTPSTNAVELQAVYDKAKTMSPSFGNTITVVVAPGAYTFGTTKFPVNTPYINIVSLTGNPDVLLDGINVIADNVYLKGLNSGVNPFSVGVDLDKLVCENCKGGDHSFSYDDEGYSFKGSYINCVGGSYSFGSSGIASGTFNYCTGGDYSFGYDGTASGTFNYCTGGAESFAGGGGGTASGTFTDCTGGDYSFGGGGGGTASGTFTNCTGGAESFGGGGGTASGTFTSCTGGAESFGGNGTASGTFTDCTGGDLSFGGGGGTASGTFTSCTGGAESFGGTASGTFTNCTGGDYSFGGGGGAIEATARLYYCRLTIGTFETPQAGGKLVFCIDGNNLPVTTP